MREKKILALVMFVMAYGLAVTTLSASYQLYFPETCNGYRELLAFCGTYLADVKSSPSSYCCNAATIAFPKASRSSDFCNCLRVVGPLLQFQSKLLSLPGACEIIPSFSMQSCIYGA
ncbi:hypothetical protein GLYMA_19G169633v4 [Glycine max]|nr:hypothetical protein GLYMA_19G169633v4 [Glycine max]KAH1078239.1 hypothetical protein GYH30_053316 [Glycine max]